MYSNRRPYRVNQLTKNLRKQYKYPRMNHRLLQRLQDLYRWDSSLRLSKRGRVSDFNVKVPQTNYTPGWLCLTRDEVGEPIALLVQQHRTPKITKVRCVLDERCYEDSILRVEYTSSSIYLADIWMWNASVLFTYTNFKQRQELLEYVYGNLYIPCREFESHEIMLRTSATSIRGYEHYTDCLSEYGTFVEIAEEDENDVYEITSTDIPDVYRLSNGGYLRVRTLELSRYLRTLGKMFKLKCIQNEDNTWSPVEISHQNTNGPTQ